MHASRPASRVFRLLAGAVFSVGVALLVWWVVAVTAYGVDVDATGSSPVFRPDHVVLFVAALSCLILGSAAPLLRWALRRRSA